MSSWVKCTCGKLIHKNLFTGTKVCVVVLDDVLNEIDEHKSAGDAVTTIIGKGDILVRCAGCGRIAIEDGKSGEITMYAPEKT
jgi:hypothetical protein